MQAEWKHWGFFQKKKILIQYLTERLKDTSAKACPGQFSSAANVLL